MLGKTKRNQMKTIKYSKLLTPSNLPKNVYRFNYSDDFSFTVFFQIQS